MRPGAASRLRLLTLGPRQAVLSAEQREIQELARAFAAGEIRPHSSRWDAEHALDDEVFDKIADLGFLGMLVPERYGGLELAWLTYLLVLEELAWGDAALALSVAVHNGPVLLLLAHGTDEQKERWLPRLASGEALGAFALSEADAGSDPRSMATRAVREAQGWRLRGAKRWVTNGARAGVVATFARTDTGSGGDGTGCFLVEPGTDGYVVGRRETTMGLRASETVEVTLDVAVGEDALLGGAERGVEHALAVLDHGRLAIAAQAVGIGRAAMEHARDYAGERQQFGRPIASFGATREKLAVMAARVTSARALVHEIARDLDGGHRNGLRPRAAMAKLIASEAAMWASDEAVQIFGGYGYMRDYPVEKLMRDAKGTEIYEGTSEILRLVIARDVLGASSADPG